MSAQKSKKKINLNEIPSQLSSISGYSNQNLEFITILSSAKELIAVLLTFLARRRKIFNSSSIRISDRRDSVFILPFD